MALLVVVLLRVRGHEKHANIQLWTAGLLLILLECAAHILYTIPTDVIVHRVSHAVALDAYLLAGVLFLRSGSDVLQRMPRSQAFVWTNAAPHLALLTLYGMDVRLMSVYHTVIGLGIFAAIVTCVLFRRGAIFYASFLLLWTPMVIATSQQGYRIAVYIVLAFLYGLVAIVFGFSLPKESRGKIAVVAGFAMWALCFLAHPLLAGTKPVWDAFSTEVWNMQKFVITVGLLLVMLERQVRSNEWLALHDELTKLPNRRLFDDRLQHAIARAERDGSRVGLFTLDLDGFKAVNDTMGHDAGDTLLQVVAQNLDAATRRTDTLARLGGDEFSLIAFDIGTGVDPNAHPMLLPQVQRICSNLVQAVENPVEVGKGDKKTVVQVSASVGLAIFPDDGTDVQALTRLADLRMYEQKAMRTSTPRRSRPVTPTLEQQLSTTR